MSAFDRVLRGDHCQCGSCGGFFNSTYAFELHRAGEHGVSRRCRSVAEMLAAGMERNTGGWWISGRNAHLAPATDSRSGDLAPRVAEAGAGAPGSQ